MSSALITGITGQDGSYLAEYLLGKGYRVIGLVRSIANVENSLPSNLLSKVELHCWDMLSQSEIIEILKCYRPVELYNLAAYSSGSGMYDDPVSIGEVNGLAVARILEAIRIVDPGIRFCQASSSEIFGEAGSSPQTELTQVNPRSPYGVAKVYADSMNIIYRNRHNIFACSAILFNHESPRRNLNFVSRKITHEAVKIKLGQSTQLRLGNLDAKRDWGYAGDYVRAMWLMLQQPHPDSYVIATGEVHTVRNFCELAFSYLNLNYHDYVLEVDELFRPLEAVDLVGYSKKATKSLGWVPEVTFNEMVKMMVDEDLRLLKN